MAESFERKGVKLILSVYIHLLDCLIIIRVFSTIVNVFIYQDHPLFVTGISGAVVAFLVILRLFAVRIVRKNSTFIPLSAFIVSGMANSIICFFVDDSVGLFVFRTVWVSILLLAIFLNSYPKKFLLGSLSISAFHLLIMSLRHSYFPQQMVMDASLLVCIILVSLIVNTICRKFTSRQIELERQNEYFVKVFAHDIKNRLHSSILTCYCLNDPSVEDATVEQIINDCRRMDRIVANLINVFSSDNIALEKEPISTKEILERFKKDWSLKLKKRDILFKIECQQHAKIEVDRRYMNLVWDNLLSNAFQHTPEGGALTVQSYNGDKYVHFVFLNSGLSIRKESQKEMFSKYFLPQKHTPYNKGLGLHYSKMMCERHGGSLEYSVDKDGLNAFIVKLPALKGKSTKQILMPE